MAARMRCRAGQNSDPPQRGGNGRPVCVAGRESIPTVQRGGEGRWRMTPPAPPAPRPTAPPFLFVMLLAARKARDRMLESLARDWLAEVGIRVVFADPLDSPT